MPAIYADLARLDAILKDRPLLDELQKRINLSTELASRITQTLPLSGRKGIFPVQFDVNEGVFWLNDRESFGSPHAAQPLLAEVKAKQVYAQFEISGPVISATRDNVGAFADALSLQLQNTLDGIKLEMAFVILAKSSGAVAVVESRTDADTFVVKNPYGLSTYKQSRPVRNLVRRGYPFDVIGASTKISDGSVTAITHSASNTTIDWSGTETAPPAANDILYRARSKDKLPSGFFDAVDTTGTYLGIARSGIPQWQGVLMDASGGGTTTVPLTPDMLRDMIDTINETSGGSPNYIVTNYKLRREILNLYSPQIRFPAANIQAGTVNFTYDDIPVIVERFFPPEHIGFVDTTTWYHVIDKDFEWIPSTQGNVLHFTLNADTYRAVLRSFRNFACLYPARNGVLYGLSE